MERNNSKFDGDHLKQYMCEIGQYSLLTPLEETVYANLIHHGTSDEKDDARYHLITSNLRLVVKIAHDFKGMGLSLVDLIEEGNIGLMHGVEKFDPTKGAKLSSYAAWWIKQAMRRGIYNQGRTIRIPVGAISRISKTKAAYSKLEKEFGRIPTPKEISEETGYHVKMTREYLNIFSTIVSLDAPIDEENDIKIKDAVEDIRVEHPSKGFDLENFTEIIPYIIERLDEREQLVIKMRFGLEGYNPNTLENVSACIGRTRERVRQVQNSALKKMKEILQKEGYMRN